MRKILKKFGITDSQSLKSIIIQFIKFGLVGVSNTLISLVIYYILVCFKCNYIVANTIGFIVSVLNAYYWNNKYVFKNNDIKEKEGFQYKKILKVYASYGITFLLSTFLLYLMVDCLNLSEYLAPIINLCITIPINFLLNKLWAFKK